MRSGDTPASFISTSNVMPKCARIVPTIKEATATFTMVRSKL
jgi:hypothetical protein